VKPGILISEHIDIPKFVCLGTLMELLIQNYGCSIWTVMYGIKASSIFLCWLALADEIFKWLQTTEKKCSRSTGNVKSSK
jgi:hypothetical protein